MKYVETPRMRGQALEPTLRNTEQAIDAYNKMELDYLFSRVKELDIHTHNLQMDEIIVNIPRVLKTLRKNVKLRIILGDSDIINHLTKTLSYVDGFYVPSTDPRMKDRVMIVFTEQPVGRHGSLLTDCVPHPEIIFKLKSTNQEAKSEVKRTAKKTVN